MDTQYNLIVTNDTKLVNKKENLFFLKKKYTLKDKNDLLEDCNNNTFNQLPYSREQIIKETEICEKIFQSIFNDLTVCLNSLNNVNYSYRAWEIILGVWLRNFIRFSYKNFIDLKFILKNYNINKIYAINPDEYSLFTQDSTSLSFAYLSDEWFYLLNAKILKYLNVSQEIIYNKSTNCFFKYDDNKHENINFKKKLARGLSQLLFFFKRNNDALIYETYLSFLNEKKLEIALGQFPQYWKKIKVKHKKFDKKLRLKINLNSYNETQNVENCIRNILPDSLPATVIESFRDINELSTKSSFPKKPKFIFTSASYYADEVFKFYVANKIENGVPYYVGQHGNNYFTAISCNHLTELKTCDKFISWGGKYGSNVYPTFNFRTLGKKKIFKKDGNLSIICGDVAGRQRFENYVSNEDDEKEAKSILYLIEKINNKIKKKTKIRIHGNFNTYSKSLYIEKLYQSTGVKVDRGKIHIKKFMKDTRVTLFNYDATGVLENLSLNMPTIFILQENLIHLNERSLEDYNLLINANILFTDIKKLITHLTNHWEDIDKWWQDEKTQLNIRKFNQKINWSGDKNSIRNLANLLKNRHVK